MADLKSNTGDLNTGDWNTGSWNTGNLNTGDLNIGDLNTGDLNTGDLNTGDLNTGHRNTGDLNIGHRNTGNWNTGDLNTGYMNTITPENILVFNKTCTREEWDNAVKPSWMYIKLTQWIDENDMSDKEKESNPSYVTTGGYLKFYSNPHHAYVEGWGKASKKDKELTRKLPNFDVDVFKEIFGFTPIIQEEEMTLEQVCKELGRDVKIIT